MSLLGLVLAHPFYAALIPIVIILILYIYRDPPKRTRHASRDQFSSAKIKTPTATFEMIPTNGVHLHTLCAGDPSNPLVVMLHGFPEFWKAWELLVDDLVNAGYYVMVPDQRGFNLSSKPLNMADYKMTNLVNDIIGLLDYAKKEKAYLCGHDLGGFVAWTLAALRPDRLHKLFIANAPHPLSFNWFVKNDKEQRKTSRYTKVFLVPFLPQRGIAKKNFKALETTLKQSSKPGSFSEDDLRAYKFAWQDHGTINCMLMWYRARFFRPLKLSPSEFEITIPVKIAWGVKDKFLKKEIATHSLTHCKNGKIEFLEEAGHWILHEEPEKVSKIMITFFQDK